MFSRAMRHRLGFTVGGAVSAVEKCVCVRSQTDVPLAVRMTGSGRLAMKPRAASAKSVRSAGSGAASRSGSEERVKRGPEDPGMDAVVGRFTSGMSLMAALRAC